MPKEKVRLVTPPNVGGGFGMKAFLYPEQAAVLWAASKPQAAGEVAIRPLRGLRLRQPGPRSCHPRGARARRERALPGLRVSTIAKLGAYLSQMGPFIPTRSTDLLSGLYTTPAIAVNVKGVCTNTVPVCAYRGAGRPRAAYVIERLVDAAAREMGMTPDAIRRINLIPPSAMPYVSRHQARHRLWRVRAGDGPRHAEGRLDRLRRAAPRERKSAASCAASAWPPIRSGAAGVFPRRLPSNSRMAVSSWSWATRNTAPGSPPRTSSSSPTASASTPTRSTSMGDTDRSPRGLTGGSRPSRRRLGPA